MKRHESLAPLSREHRAALLLAQLLKKNAPVYKGLPTDPGEKVNYALKLFNDSLKEHFRMEELLLEKTEHCHPYIHMLGQEIRKEHEQLTASFLTIRNAANTTDAMDALGNGLEMHIRKEERVLFPLIQDHCPEELLKEISHLLH